MNNTIVRAVRCADLAAVTAIYAAEVLHGTASFEVVPPTVSEMNSRFEALVAGGYPYRVAEVDGRLAGYAYAGPYRPRPAYRFTVEDSVYVAPWARRGGVGRALLVRLVADCELAGFRQMIAVIGDSAHQASIGLHESLGFHLVGVLERVGYKFDRWLDSVIMQRALSPERCGGD